MSTAPDRNESSDPSDLRPHKTGCFLPNGVALQTWAVETRANYEHVTNLYQTFYGEGSWGNASTFVDLLGMYAANLTMKSPSKPLSSSDRSEPSQEVAALISLFDGSRSIVDDFDEDVHLYDLGLLTAQNDRF
ncbi:hypothetical protein E8E11_000679 [Didymella keratinophila]|nr:hypothetical protein E8E11_000679 [Didymella keratinophila]